MFVFASLFENTSLFYPLSDNILDLSKLKQIADILKRNEIEN